MGCHEDIGSGRPGSRPARRDICNNGKRGVLDSCYHPEHGVKAPSWRGEEDDYRSIAPGRGEVQCIVERIGIGHCYGAAQLEDQDLPRSVDRRERGGYQEEGGERQKDQEAKAEPLP